MEMGFVYWRMLDWGLSFKIDGIVWKYLISLYQYITNIQALK